MDFKYVERKIEGKTVTRGYTLKSMYDQNSIEVVVQREGAVETFRIRAEVIVEMMRFFDFKTRLARVHEYLELDSCSLIKISSDSVSGGAVARPQDLTAESSKL